ncbi:hypothetical protein QVD17_38553 [Tagetes erecta]|uniref:Protein TIC 20 n=1 Tax=Tagetes erecta TaxID=13708 RepID=A0AAD8JND7_TARER|nr:hypothetical protein QVD17_38553 [Tagetes erecta]
MTISNTLSSFTLSPYKKTPSFHSPSFNPQTQTLTLTLTPIKFTHHNHRSTLIIPKSTNNNNSIDGPDRLISSLCYFYPFFDGIQYGKHAITQFTFLQTLIQPLIPSIKVFKSFPLNGTLMFLVLYFGVVRNPNFSRYVRFNAMQAIVLDVLLIFPDLIERGVLNGGDDGSGNGIGFGLIMSLESSVFLFLLVCLIYGSCCCSLGIVPRLPIVADAADKQVM